MFDCCSGLSVYFKAHELYTNNWYYVRDAGTASKTYFDTPEMLLKSYEYKAMAELEAMCNYKIFIDPIFLN